MMNMPVSNPRLVGWRCIGLCFGIVFTLAVTGVLMERFTRRGDDLHYYQSATHQKQAVFAVAIRAFVHDCGVDSLKTNKLPDLLYRRVSSMGVSGGPYLDGKANDDEVDAWGQQMQFKLLRQSVQIVSAGPDGRFYTSDDITLEVQVK